MKSIKFGNKTALQIVSNDIKNKMKESIKDVIGMELTTRTYKFLNEQTLHLLNKNKDDFKVCINTFGHKYLLYLTKYNNKNYCIFINKKREDMISVKFRFKDELYNNTLFDGELIKDMNNNQIYAISDIIMYQNEFILTSKSMKERIEIIKKIYNEDTVHDEMINFCKLDIKKYFNLKYLDDIYKRYINSIPYKCSGLYFQHKTDYKRSMMYIFPEFRTNDSAVATTTLEQPKQQLSQSSQPLQPSQPLIVNTIDINKSFNFQIKQTDLPDIYQLYYYKQNNLISFGYAGVPDMSTSKLLNDIFDKMGDADDVQVVVKCDYSTNFNKWIPKMVVNENIGRCK